MNPDSYNFIAFCPSCKEKRGVSCSKQQAQTGNPIKVYAIQCNHHWTLTVKDSKLLLEKSETIHA